jgi:hypothetical protein
MRTNDHIIMLNQYRHLGPKTFSRSSQIERVITFDSYS